MVSTLDKLALILEKAKIPFIRNTNSIYAKSESVSEGQTFSAELRIEDVQGVITASCIGFGENIKTNESPEGVIKEFISRRNQISLIYEN